MIVATHEMGFARDVASKVCYLHQGQIIEEGPPEQDLHQPGPRPDVGVPPPHARGGSDVSSRRCTRPERVSTPRSRRSAMRACSPPRRTSTRPCSTWEREHIFDGRLGRGGSRRRPVASHGSAGRGVGGRRQRPASSATATSCTGSRTCAGTVVTSSSPIGERGVSPRRSAARTTRGPTTSTARCGLRPGSTTAMATSSRIRPSTRSDRAAASTSISVGCSRTLDGAACSARRRVRRASTRSSRRTTSATSRPVETRTYEVAANWKVIHENYQECLHCPFIHPELCRVSPPDSSHNLSPGPAWVGGWMDLAAHAATMSMTGEAVAAPLPGLDERTAAPGRVHRDAPEPPGERAPRLRDDAPGRAARRRPDAA